MEKRGASPFGDPCGGCGFEWSLTPREAIGIVQELPTRFRVLLAGRTGFGRHPDLAWTPAAYVSHVTANLRNWAERLAGARLYGAVDVPGHDPDLVVQARHYNEIAPRRGPVVVGTRSGSLGGIDQDRTVIRADPRQPSLPPDAWRRHITLAMLALAFLATSTKPVRSADPNRSARSSDPIDLTIPEIRHLIGTLLKRPSVSVTTLLAWSFWRRRHQARARRLREVVPRARLRADPVCGEHQRGGGRPPGGRRYRPGRARLPHDAVLARRDRRLLRPAGGRPDAYSTRVSTTSTPHSPSWTTSRSCTGPAPSPRPAAAASTPSSPMPCAPRSTMPSGSG